MGAIEAGIQAATPATSRSVGRYQVCAEIASGGMASVHVGRLIGAAGFSRTVAIKRLHPQFAKDPDFVAMFLDEARLAARIDHPNVISMLDVVVDGSDLILVMEYVRGAPLSLLRHSTHGRSAPIPAPIAASIMCGVLCGLHAAHDATDEMGVALRIVHRDVSPQNVLVGTDGLARVFDFGIAKAMGRLQTTRQGQLKGKLSYMAPEQIDDAEVSPRTDVYAASVVLWECLTGQRLFLASDERATLSRVLSATVPAPSALVPGLPADLDDVVLRGLDRDPERRYATAHEMAVDLARACPVASAEDVGEWVSALAHDELARCSTLLGHSERAVPSRPSLPALTVDVPSSDTRFDAASSLPGSASGPAPRRSHLVAALAAAALVSMIPITLGHRFAHSAGSAPTTACGEAREGVAPGPEVHDDTALSGPALRSGSARAGVATGHDEQSANFVRAACP